MTKKQSTNSNISIVIFGTLAFIGLVTAQAVMNDKYGDEDMKSHESGHHDDHGMDNHMHSHDQTYDVNASQAPSVSVTVVEDAMSGWNVRIETDNFKFSPDNVNGDNVIGEGHAHLYVDGVKVARLYGPDYHYGENFDGTRTFRVTLNANDHSEYAVDGKVIDAVVEVTHSHE